MRGGAAASVGRRAAALVLVLCGLGALATKAPAAPASSSTPPGRVLVVTQNLQEAFGDADLRTMREASVFARRLLGQAPAVPDVLLLQEVRKDSATRVAKELGERTGVAFEVVIAAREAWVGPRRLASIRDSAIVINTATMKVDGEASFLGLSYPSSAASSKPREVRYAAVAKVARRDGSLSVALATPHLVTARYFSSKEVDRRYKHLWTKQLADELAARYPATGDTDVAVIAGDFNRPRCDIPGHECEPSAFWKELVGRRSYFDAVWTISKKPWKGGVDYIFSTGEVLDSGGDWLYDPDQVADDPSRYYSDHRLRWALLGDVPPYDCADYWNC